MSAWWVLSMLLGCGQDCETPWYADLDGDGYGDRRSVVTACERPPATVANADDCDDRRASVRPDADDDCDGIDTDCDGELDEDGDIVTYYRDADGDGMGSASSSWTGCGAPPPGYTALQAGDCDDLDFHVRSGRSEVCNGVDDDCDGQIDEGAVDVQPYFVDVDLDGFGGSERVFVCPSQQGTLVENSDDCDDLSETIYPGADERCNGVDDDCDGRIDEDAIDTTTVYLDLDEDGYGRSNYPVEACDPSSGTVPFYSYYDVLAVSVSIVAGDCDDDDANVHPGVAELCNGIDDDCDGRIDDEDDDILLDDLVVWYVDFDRDGYGQSTNWVQTCDRPAGNVWALDPGDCDDDDDLVHPDATELCNGIDDDCDGDVDDADDQVPVCP